jgi:hypothetical protein
MMSKEVKHESLMRCRLSDVAGLRVMRILRNLPRPTAATFREYVPEYLKALAQLEREVSKRVHQMTLPDGPGGLLIENCPKSSSALPETPEDGKASTKKEQFVEENFLVAIGLMLGKPIAFAAEKGGELVPNVIPIQGSEYKVSNEGSISDLLLHVELVHLLNYGPSYSLLGCLRPDPLNQAVTVIVDVRDIVPHLSKEHLAELRKPQYRIEVPASFVINEGGERLSALTPIIKGPEQCPQIIAEFNSTVSLNEAADEAFQALREACEMPGVAIELRLKENDLLILSNFRTMHGRRSFLPDWSSSSQRWLIRMNVLPDYWPVRHATDASQVVITTAFVPQL